MIAAAGIDQPGKLHRSYIHRRISAAEIKTYAEIYPYILRGCLLEAPYPPQYELDMANSVETTFAPAIKYA